jgi:hypothetical protein
MRPPVQASTRILDPASRVDVAVYPVRRVAQRVTERRYDQSGRLLTEHVGEYLAHEWTVVEREPDAEAVAPPERPALDSAGCLAEIIGAVVVTAFFVGLAVVGALAGEWLAGRRGIPFGLVGAVVFGLLWARGSSAPPS